MRILLSLFLMAGLFAVGAFYLISKFIPRPESTSWKWILERIRTRLLFRLRLSSFFALMAPTYLTVLWIIGWTVPPEYSNFNWILLLWLILSVLCPALFILWKEPDLLKMGSGSNTYINTVYCAWAGYALLTFGCILFKNSYRINTISDTLFWIVPLQWIMIGWTLSVLRKEGYISELADEKESPNTIPAEIYRDQASFNAYCLEKIRQGDAFQVLLAVKKGREEPFLKSKESDSILLEGQWRENEKDFKQMRITADVYNVNKVRLMEAIRDVLVIA